MLAVDTIYGLIDFHRFKESILRYKKDSEGLAKDETAAVGLTLGQQDESLFWEYQKQDHNDPASGWTKKLE
jgi:hypothetical protein